MGRVEGDDCWVDSGVRGDYQEWKRWFRRSLTLILLTVTVAVSRDRWLTQ